LPNDYEKEVYNGDISSVVDTDLELGELNANFDGRQVTYGFGKLDSLVPAYAITIHKSQGLEYPAVVIPVITQHYTMLQRNLLYTGVTRKTIGRAGRAKKSDCHCCLQCRWSKLNDWLSARAQPSSWRYAWPISCMVPAHTALRTRFLNGTLPHH
jgi:exodeoxyribonuclease V alpha subunit